MKKEKIKKKKQTLNSSACALVPNLAYPHHWSNKNQVAPPFIIIIF